MPNDVIFKTKTFGGFDKREVLDYVNKVLAEKSDVEKEIAELTKKLDEAQNENGQVMADLAEQKKVVSEKVDEIRFLINMVEQQKVEIAELTEKAVAAEINEKSKEELEYLRAEVARLKAECERKHDIERQVGAAMLDARRHSEELVEEAREKANNVTKSVYAAIGDTALKIDDLSVGIGEIARSFAKSVEEVELRIKALTGDMSKTAQLLIAESGMISEVDDSKVPTVEYDFSSSVDEFLNDDNE